MALNAAQRTMLVWVERFVAAAILTIGAIPKFTGAAGALAQKLPGGNIAVIAIGILEAITVVLLLVPKFSPFGALLATGIFTGAVLSHILGPVGMQGDFLMMFLMALIGLSASVVLLYMQKSRLIASLRRPARTKPAK